MFKKMLLILSVLALAGGAFAADADWTFYGVGHVSINVLNNGEDSQLGLTSNTSRFGFKGTAPMNEDFTAFWQFESLVDFAGNTASYSPGDYGMWEQNSGGNVIGTRNTYVGMKHATAGKLMLGRHDTPFKTLGRKVEFFPDQLGDFRALTMGWDNRMNELIAYASPDWDGFSIFAAYQFDQGDMGAEEAMTSMSAMAAYQGAQFLIGAAYEAGSSGWGKINENDDYSDGPSAYRFVAKYMGEKFEVGGLYQGATIQQVADDGIAFEDWNTSTMGLGAMFKVSPKWNLKGAMFMGNFNTDAEDASDTPDIDESDATATQWALGVERVFTENVLAYLQYGAMSNGDVTNAALAGQQSGFNNANSGGLNGTYDTNGELQDPSGFSIGTVITW